MSKSYKIGGNLPDRQYKSEVKGAIPQTIDSSIFENVDDDIHSTRREEIKEKYNLFTKNGRIKANGLRPKYYPVKLANNTPKILNNEAILHIMVDKVMRLEEIYMTILNKANSKIFDTYWTLASTEQKKSMEIAFKKRYGHQRLKLSNFKGIQNDLEILMIKDIPNNVFLKQVTSDREEFRESQEGRYAPKKYIQEMLKNGDFMRELHDGIVDIGKSPVFDLYDAFGTVHLKDKVYSCWKQKFRKKDIKNENFSQTQKNLEGVIRHFMP